MPWFRSACGRAGKSRRATRHGKPRPLPCPVRGGNKRSATSSDQSASACLRAHEGSTAFRHPAQKDRWRSSSRQPGIVSKALCYGGGKRYIKTRLGDPLRSHSREMELSKVLFDTCAPPEGGRQLPDAFPDRGAPGVTARAACLRRSRAHLVTRHGLDGPREDGLVFMGSSPPPTRLDMDPAWQNLRST